jgi:hypothetical protein
METRCVTVAATGRSGSSGRDRWLRKGSGADMREKRTTRNVIWIRSVAGTVALIVSVAFQAACTQAPVSPAEARAIAKEAYIYGFPLADSYRVLYASFVNREDPDYKTPWNQIKDIARVYTPDDRAVQTPNADTPYSWLGLDLRAEPMVLTVPPIEKGRYFSIQLVDLYTHNFGYIGSRTTGNDGGSFLIAGPGWKGSAPDGIKQVIRSETELVVAIYRTQLFNPADIENVKAIQAGYEVQPLSAFLGQPAPKPAPAIDFIKPLTRDELTKSPTMVLGIWGNSAEEAMYPTYLVDADGQKLDGSHRYALRFAPGKLPPARSFWSLTMYELPESLLVANPIDRYLLNSTMLADFVRDPDGGITLYVQHGSPGKAREPNRLPAPEGPFVVVMRLYWPKPEALDGTWKQPPLKRVQ